MLADYATNPVRQSNCSLKNASNVEFEFLQSFVGDIGMTELTFNHYEVIKAPLTNHRKCEIGGTASARVRLKLKKDRSL